MYLVYSPETKHHVISSINITKKNWPDQDHANAYEPRGPDDADFINDTTKQHAYFSAYQLSFDYHFILMVKSLGSLKYHPFLSNTCFLIILWVFSQRIRLQYDQHDDIASVVMSYITAVENLCKRKDFFSLLILT
jgi:hypothetical protein